MPLTKQIHVWQLRNTNDAPLFTSHFPVFPAVCAVRLKLPFRVLILQQNEGMNRNTFHSFLSASYGRLGRLIGRHPLYFFFVPFGISVLFSLGILNISFSRDLFSLFTPSNGRSIRDLQKIQKLFPSNSTEYDVTRLLKEGTFMNVIIRANNGTSILRNDVFKEIRQVHDIIENVTVLWNGELLNYSQLCATNFGKCPENFGLLTDEDIHNFHTGRFTMKYPVEIVYVPFKVTPYSQNFGGVTCNEDGNITDALAFRLFYFLDSERTYMLDKMKEWQQKAIESVESKKFHHIRVSKIASFLKESYASEFTENALPLSGISALCIFGFCMVICITSDWVTSKPWLGILACVSASLATIGGFGAVMLFGISYIDMNIALPFLMLGMGIDDSFVLLAAWRRSNKEGTVEERMEEVYHDVAASITITSLTNSVSFLVGLLTPFPVVSIFCTYAASGVLFTFIFQLTFFGSCIALTGYREAKGLNPFTFRKVKRKASAEHRGRSLHSNNKTSLGYTIGGFMRKPAVKFAAFILYIGCLALGICGCLHMKIGLDPRDVLPTGSQSLDLMEANYKYFTKYAHRIHVVINEPLNYADTATINKIEHLLQRYETHPLIADPSFTESWLRAFKTFAANKISSFSLGPFDLSDKQDFIDGLRVFFHFPQTRTLLRDVVFSENDTDILASRFFLLCNQVRNKEEEKELLEHVWKVTDESELSVISFSYWFPFYEQLTVVKGASIQIVCIGATAILVIFFIVIPDLMCSLLVTLTILSIQVEVIGIMSLWNVSLDIFSMMNLIMCVGFSINYPAHLTYAYVTSGCKDADSSVKSALYAVAIPIFQGSLSTLIGVSILIIDSSYMFLVFVKIVFLVVLLTGIHALIFLPAALHTFDRFLCFRVKLSKQTANGHISNGTTTVNETESKLWQNAQTILT